MLSFLLLEASIRVIEFLFFHKFTIFMINLINICICDPHSSEDQKSKSPFIMICPPYIFYIYANEH